MPPAFRRLSESFRGCRASEGKAASRDARNCGRMHQAGGGRQMLSSC